MRSIALLLAPLAALSPATTVAAARCDVIALDVSGPRPMVAMRMNGRAPVKALFDTGNMSTTVDLDQASALGVVSAGPLKPPFDQQKSGYQTLLKHVSIGDLEIGDISAAAMPSMMPGVAAIVGPSTFGNRYVTLDFAASQLRVCPRTAANRPPGPGEPYTGAPVILPAIPVTAGSQHLAAHIDTGSPLGLSLPMRFAKALTLAEPLEKIGVARGHFGESPIYRATISGPVQVGALSLDSPQVHFSDIFPGPNVGGALLRRMRITIDPVARRAWTTARTAP